MTTGYNIVDPFLYGKQGATHSNPYYTYSQLYSPKRLRDLFKWCEYLFYNSSHIYAALRKFGEYPITEVTYDTTNEALKQKHKVLLQKVIRIRELLIKATLDKFVYGNAFISMYQPFVRYLRCPHCSTLTNIQHINYKFSVRNLHFSYTCRACGTAVRAKEKDVEDRKRMLSRNINFIRWDPKKMDIDHNPMTGESVYYYEIPQSVIQRVNDGHKMLIDTLPMGFLKAIKKNKPFRFAPDAVFHMKIGGPAGINPQWGLPPLITALQLFHYTAVLRKANEAIALEYLVPFRIIHPAQQSGNADPVQQISLENWRDEMARNFKMWRKDPLHTMWAPIPVGMTQVGGQGRALLTLGEVQEAEKNIVAALGIPIEFLYGGLTKSGMEATLRLIENQLETHVNDLKDLLQWVDDSCSKFLGWEKVPVSLTKFRMVDDYNKQGMMLQLWQQGKEGGPQVVSDTTMAELNDIDLSQEEERIKQETLDAYRRQRELNAELQKLQNNLADKALQEAQSGGSAFNQQQILGQADMIVQELAQMDEGMRKSRLHELQVSDQVLYAVVIQRWEQYQTNMTQAAKSSMGMG